MDCKIVITCEKCKCKAELSPPTWMEANAYTCPNCRERMPADYWMLLKKRHRCVINGPKQLRRFLNLRF